MAGLIHHAQVSHATPLEMYRVYDQPGQDVATLRRRGAAVEQALGAAKVWMLNSTEFGGGVAELIPGTCSLMSQVEVDTRWLVMKPVQPEFFKFTKHLHNMIHGVSDEEPTPEQKRIYDEVSRTAADELRAIVNRSDVLIVHDPQPLGAALYIPAEHRPRLIWRCHIGVPKHNEATRRAWRFLDPYLAPFQRLLFSAEQYIPDTLFPRSGVQLPGIDPINEKNRLLSPYKLIGVLRAAGLLTPEVSRWARFSATVIRFNGGEWTERPIADFLSTPVALQVSRFDRLKGFDLLLNAFVRLLHTYRERVTVMKVNTERALEELGGIQLLLAGPDPGGVHDDPEAVEILSELTRRIMALEPAIQHRVHLLRLPMVDARENALIVNALQRFASVVVQASREEGFGLTVSEAMWKGAPVVASAVGGIALQIRPGVDGFLVRDPADADELAGAMLTAMADAKRSDVMTREAHSRVRSHFLLPGQLASWLSELERLLGLKPAENAAVSHARA